MTCPKAEIDLGLIERHDLSAGQRLAKSGANGDLAFRQVTHGLFEPNDQLIVEHDAGLQCDLRRVDELAGLLAICWINAESNGEMLGHRLRFEIPVGIGFCSRLLSIRERTRPSSPSTSMRTFEFRGPQADDDIRRTDGLLQQQGVDTVGYIGDVDSEIAVQRVVPVEIESRAARMTRRSSDMPGSWLPRSRERRRDRRSRSDRFGLEARLDRAKVENRRMSRWESEPSDPIERHSARSDARSRTLHLSSKPSFDRAAFWTPARRTKIVR